MPRFGMDVVLAHPPEFRLMPEIMEQAREQARKFGSGFEVVDDMEAAFKDAGLCIEWPGRNNCGSIYAGNDVYDTGQPDGSTF